MPVLHQLCPALRPGDAISNQAAAIQRIAQAHGIAARAWHCYSGSHPTLPSRPFQRCRPQPSDVLLLHYSAASALDDFARAHAAQLALCYHNITPPEFFAPFNPALAAQLQAGRAHLQTQAFGERVRLYAGTAFNRAELRAWGYADVGELPYVLSPQPLRDSAQSQAGQALTAQLRERVNWLFVGRIAPNKRQHILVRAFAAYTRRFEPNARLFLLGSAQSSGGYERYVRAHIAALGLQAQVQLLAPSDQDLGAYYAAADVFVSLSEHEGLGVPLVEAMWLDVPVVALARAAVPETLGDAGLLLESDDPDLVAACVYTLLTQPKLRARVLEAQRRRVEAFDTAQAEAQVAQTLRSWFAVRAQRART